MDKRIPLTSTLTVYGADIVHTIMGFDAHSIRSWRSRGFFGGGEKIGRGYVYNIVDIAKLSILREMQDVGVKMMTATTASTIGALDLVGHVLNQAPMLEVWAMPKSDMDGIIGAVRTDPQGFRTMFDTDTDFHTPYDYLVTGGDDYDDWQLIDDLDQLAEMEDYNLATISLPLDKLAARVIAVFKELPEALGHPSEYPATAINFYTMDCVEGLDIWTARFSLNPEHAPILGGGGDPKPDLKVVQ